MEVSNYLFCYSEEDKSYKNYRLSNIKYAYILEEKRLKGDREYIKQVRRDFDPFLSYGHNIVIKLSEEGKTKYQRIKTNRPKLIKKLEDRWIVEGSDEKIKRYFSYFMSDVEIISPENLREWFRKEAIEIIELYK